MSEKTVEQGYCPKCGAREVMGTIKVDGTAYHFCKDCDWHDKKCQCSCGCQNIVEERMQSCCNYCNGGYCEGQ